MHPSSSTSQPKHKDKQRTQKAPVPQWVPISLVRTYYPTQLSLPLADYLLV